MFWLLNWSHYQTKYKIFSEMVIYTNRKVIAAIR